MALLTAQGVHIDRPLQNMTIAFLQSTTAFIADRVFPRVSVEKQSDLYYVWNRDYFNTDRDVKVRAPFTYAQEVSLVPATGNYFTKTYSLASPLSSDMLANEDAALMARQAVVEMLTMNMMIHREKLWVSSFFGAGIWGTNWTGVSGAPSANEVRQWSDYVNSTPIIDITNLMRTIQLKSGGFKPNVMVVGKEVRDQLVNHPTILNRLNGGATVTNTALVTDAKLAEIFGVEDFLVMESVQNTALEGLTESNAFIGGKGVLLVYRARTAGMMSATAGATFVWDNQPDSSGYGVGAISWANEELRRKRVAEVIEITMGYDQKVTGADLGAFIASVVA